MNVLEKILEEIEHEAMNNKEIGRKQCEGMARAMEIIRSHMNDDSDGWIPCGERLPEEREEVEVTIEEKADEVGGIRRYTKRAWMQDGRWIIKRNPYNPRVIAWQPLPEPYKPKETTATCMEHIMSRFTKVE